MGQLLHCQPSAQDIFQTQLSVVVEEHIKQPTSGDSRYAKIFGLPEIPTSDLQVSRRCLSFPGRELCPGMITLVNNTKSVHVLIVIRPRNV